MTKQTGVFGKLAGLVIAAIMAFAMIFTSMPAFAADGDTTTKNDSITVNKAVANETYNLYKMMDLKVDSETDPKAYTYTVNSDWSDFFKTGAGKDYVTLDGTDGHVTWVEAKKDASSMSAFSKAAAAYAASKNITAVSTKKADSTSVEFTGLADGYYLITSTLGTVAMTETTPAKTAVTVEEKNPEDTIEKKVQEDSTSEWGKENDAQVGDTVHFQSAATLIPNTRNVKIHDTMDAGLTFTAGSIAVKNGDTALTEGTDYTLTPVTEGDTFTITFTDSYVNSLTEATTLTITYDAVLNKDAVSSTGSLVDEKNKTKITYGDKQSKEDETVTKTHSFTVKKHNSDNQLLEGAVFTLKKAGTALKLTKIDEHTYKVDPRGTETTFTTKSDAVITILGVDSDDDYTLTEETAPAGYNKLTKDVEVKVNAENTYEADVLNQSGSTLPSTGGIGTTIFYVLGAILVIGAGVVLFVRRRVSRR